jgi:hypothetical protein
MNYDNHTPGESNLTLSPSQKFFLGICSKLLDCSAWVIRWRSECCFLATWVTFEVQSVSGDVKLGLSLATWVPDPTEASSDLSGNTLIIERVYLFLFLKFASLGLAHVILYPMEETTLESGFALRSFDNLTPGVSNLTLSPSRKFCLGIGSKVLDWSTWMIRWRSTCCFLATWVTFEVQSVSGDVKLDLSLATWVPDPTEAFSDLWGSILIIERVYLF